MSCVGHFPGREGSFIYRQRHYLHRASRRYTRSYSAHLVYDGTSGYYRGPPGAWTPWELSLTHGGCHLILWCRTVVDALRPHCAATRSTWRIIPSNYQVPTARWATAITPRLDYSPLRVIVVTARSALVIARKRAVMKRCARTLWQTVCRAAAQVARCRRPVVLRLN